MTEAHDVVVAGAGPTGLMLAGELALAGVDVLIVERRADQFVDGSRAKGLLARSIEVLDQRGIADRFLEAGYVVTQQGFAGTAIDISDLPSRHPHVLALPQSEFEPILAGWVEELGVPILRGRTVRGLAQDDDGVDVELDDGVLRGQYLVGCDGGRSIVRKAAGIEFAGTDASTSWMIAEVEMTDEPAVGFRHDELGTHAMNRLADDGPIGLVLTEREVEDGEPTLDDLRDALTAVYDTDFGVHDPHWISRFTDMARQAVRYRAARVLVAGDAAHVHPPHGGQGMGTGLQDAVNLGWKLAQVVDGTSPSSLLDTYHDERHPVGERVLRNAMTQVLLAMPDARHQALRETVLELVANGEARRHLASELSGLAIRYDLGDGHPLVGRRMPDLDLATADGPVRVFELLRDGRPLLLDLGDDGGFDTSPWPRVRLVEASTDNPWELPAIGGVQPPAAVLVRPDGHVAWTGWVTDPGLPKALTNWFGTG